MAGHDDKRQQVIALPGKVIERIDDQTSQPRILQVADGGFLIQPLLRPDEAPLPLFDGPLLFTLVFRAWPALQFGAIVVQVEHAPRGDTALEAGREKIRRVGHVPMRQVSSPDDFFSSHAAVLFCRGGKFPNLPMGPALKKSAS